MPQTRQGQDENGDVGENVWQADVAVARHDVRTVTLNHLVPLELEGLADSEGRNNVCDGMGYAHSDDDPCADSHRATGKDPEVQDQDGELWEQACHHVDELGRRLHLEILCYDGRVGQKPISHMTTSTSFIDEHFQVEVSNNVPGQQVSPKGRDISPLLGRLTKAKGPEANIENVGKSWEYPYFPGVSLGKGPRNEEKDVHKGSQDREGERDVEECTAGILSKVLRRQGHELLSSRDLSHDGISEVPVLGASLEWIVPSGLDFSVFFFPFLSCETADAAAAAQMAG